VSGKERLESYEVELVPEEGQINAYYVLLLREVEEPVDPGPLGLGLRGHEEELVLLLGDLVV